MDRWELCCPLFYFILVAYNTQDPNIFYLVMHRVIVISLRWTYVPAFSYRFYPSFHTRTIPIRRRKFNLDRCAEAHWQRPLPYASVSYC